jgi:hypothetical protein
MQPGALPPPPVPGSYPQPVPQYGFQGYVPHARNEDVLVAVNGSVFPQVCPMCGQAGTVQKKVALQYIPKWARLFGWILMMATAKRATVYPWFCEPCVAASKKHQVIGFVLIFLGILGIVFVGLSPWLMLLGAVLLIGGVVVSNKGRKLRVKLITKDTVTLKKTHPGFRSILPIAP